MLDVTVELLSVPLVQIRGVRSEDRTPAQVAAIYNKRSRIEKSYEKFREVRAVTTTPSTTIRLFYVGVSFLLEQLWIVLQWAVLAQPRRDG